MKRFITISLLALLALTARPCIWIDTHNYYLFSVYDNMEFSTRVQTISEQNWKTYLGRNDESYFNFDADDVAEAARQKGDDLMVSYVQHLERYLQCARDVQMEVWDYPTKQSLAERRQTLENVRIYALGKTKSRLRSQHALLYMRCNMLLGRHADNVQFWEQTAKDFIETVYKDMMKDIYAGALLKTGKADKAGEIFAELGDWESLMTQYYKKRSFQAIRQEYVRDPNSAVLPFLLQDFVNNAQEAVDAENEMGMDGKLFIRRIERSEAEQMWKFADQVVREGKTSQPALWKSAKAWLTYLYGDRREALHDINAAVKLEGSERVKDCARVLKLYISAAQTPDSPSFDDYLAGELEWIDQKTTEDLHYKNALDRLVHQVLTDKFTRANRQNRAAALLNATHTYEFRYYVDTMKVERLINFIAYANKPADNRLDQFLTKKQELDADDMNDLVGTKYMRLCQWDNAVQWLRKVPSAFYDRQGYAVYAANRSYTVEPWIKRQFLSMSVEYGEFDPKLKANPKLTFATEMQQMESSLAKLKGKALAQQQFNLAVRYAQASITGDCWYLMRDGKSIYDTVRVNETDLQAKAVTLLREASKTSDPKLKERTLFALTYGYLYPEWWVSSEWDDQALTYVKRTNPQSLHYQALLMLATYERANINGPSDYVSRCDNYQYFKKKKSL